MKNLTLIALAFVATVSNAECYGSGSIKNCYDDNGNSYTVQRIGNSTYVEGTSSNGSSWSQQSMRTGNTTFTTGTSANGNSWDSTTINTGSMTTTFGTDSNGNSFESTCFRTSSGRHICN